MGQDEEGAWPSQLRYPTGAPTTITSNPDEEDVLYGLATDSESLFEDMLEALQATELAGLRELCSEFQQRFAIWTAHLGVFAIKSQCLDTRLRGFPDLQDVTVRLLDLLRRCLYQWKYTALHPIEENMEQLQTTLRGVDDTLSRLNNLGVTIRQASADKADIRARRIAMGDDSTMLRYLCAQAVQVLYPETSQALKDWLVHFMAVRWGRVKDLNKRQEKLSTRRPPRQSLGTILEIPGDKTQLVQNATQLPTAGPSNSLTSLPPISATQSELSSINMHHIRNRNRPPDELSTKFSKTMSVQIKQGHYPKPPGKEISGTHFACQWCSELIDRRTLTDSSWRRHIDQDLKPYACLSGDCHEADKGYPNFSQWFEHMQSHGRRWHQKLYPTFTWICTLCQSGSHTYNTPQALYNHLQDLHMNDFSETQLHTISRQSKKEQERALDDCLLCSFAVEDESHTDYEAGSKRQKKPLANESNKSIRTSLSMRSAGSIGPDNKNLDDTTSSDLDSDSSSESRTTKPVTNRDFSVVVARHIASHLQVLMLLTLRFAALTNDPGTMDTDEGNSESVELDEEENTTVGESERVSSPDLDATFNQGEFTDMTVNWDQGNRNGDIDIPDCDTDITVPSRYDTLAAEDDTFLQGVLQSGAYQSWRDERDKDEDQTSDNIENPFRSARFGGETTITKSPKEPTVTDADQRAAFIELGRKLVHRPGMPQPSFNLDEPGRRMIYRGSLTQVSKNATKWTQVDAILLDNYLILAKTFLASDEEEMYDVYTEPIPMALLFFEIDNEDLEDQNLISVQVSEEVLVFEDSDPSIGQTDAAATESSNGKVSTSDNRPGIARTKAFRRDHLPVSFNHKRTVSVLYQFNVKHLGSTTYTLLAESAHDRDTWCHHLREAQTSFAHSLHEQNAEPFRLRVLSDAALPYEVLPYEALRTPLRVSDTPLDIAITQAETAPGPVQGSRSISSARVYCASSFTTLGEPIVAIGTTDGIFIWNDMDLDRMNHSRWTKTVTIPGVTQMSSALEDFGLFLIISGGDLFAYPLDLITPKDFTPARAPRKVAKSVSFFTVAKMKDRTLVFYKVQDGPFRTLVKVLEPLPPPEMAPKTGRLSRSRSLPETSFFREYDEFFLSTECSSLSIFQTYIVVATNNCFEMLTLRKKQPMTIPDLKEPSIAAIASLIKDQKPLKMFRLKNDEFLLAYERCAVYVDKHGDVSRSVVMEYISKARGVTSATMHGAYLILCTDEYVEVRNAENGRLRQIIAGKDIRILDYGGRQPGGDLASSSQTQAEDDTKEHPSVSHSNGNIKFAMGHPDNPTRQLVLEMCLKDGH